MLCLSSLNFEESSLGVENSCGRSQSSMFCQAAQCNHHLEEAQVSNQRNLEELQQIFSGDFQKCDYSKMDLGVPPFWETNVRKALSLSLSNHLIQDPIRSVSGDSAKEIHGGDRCNMSEIESHRF